MLHVAIAPLSMNFTLGTHRRLFHSSSLQSSTFATAGKIHALYIPVMSTWQDRLKAAIGPRGYENCMRRSLQTVILYEAKRCIAHRLSSLRPFQRKAAYMDQANALLESLDFLYPHQKTEVLWRTASSKETLDSEIAWKREKGIEKSFLELSKKIKGFMPKAKTHNDACDLLIQHLFENLTNQTGKPAPTNWEHSHNHCKLMLRCLPFKWG